MNRCFGAIRDIYLWIFETPGNVADLMKGGTLNAYY